MARGGRCIGRSAASACDGSGSHLNRAMQIARAGVPATSAAPSKADIFRAVASLYNDELRPYSRILKKRLVEHSDLPEFKVKNIDEGRLRALCEESAQLHVLKEEGGEWSVELISRAPTFVDVYDTRDIYSNETWAAAENYFRSLQGSKEDTLPGGRYATAVALAKRNLPFLAGFSLGRICHFTQIATSQRQLLGYANGRMVPFASSLSVVKAQFAEHQLPLVGSSSGDTHGSAAIPIAGLSVARVMLQDILATAKVQGSLPVPISNVKRIFRSRYQLELSETALGHCRLTDLLRGERFRDICEVQLQDRGYVVLPATKSLVDASFDAHPILGDSSSKGRTLDVAPGPIPCETSHLSSQHADFDGVEFTQRFCPDEPLCLEDADKPSMKEISPATAPFPFPTPSPQYDYSGSHGGNAFTWNLACRSLRMASSTHGHHARETRSLWMHSDCGKEASAIEEPPSVPKQLFCPDEPLDLEAARQEVSKAWMSPAPCCAWTPSPHYPMRSSLSYRINCTDATAGSTTSQNPSRSTSAESRSLVVLSKSGSSSRSNSHNDGDHNACLPATVTGCHQSHNVCPLQQPACNKELPLSSSLSNQGRCQPIRQHDLHVAHQGHQPVIHQNQRLGMAAPPLVPTVFRCMFQQFPKLTAAPDGSRLRDEVCVNNHREPTGLSATRLPVGNGAGSEAHARGTCKPCAHFHSKNGCRNAEQCLFCHSCPPGELNRRQNAKKRLNARQLRGA
mmetsp:Transcript_86255/g.171263  ORF Transcript_86255/g.171263 Transcript_86255/m.171263 type:complete len:738 (+) Transcript_86255:71-2284(+)